MPTLHAPGSMPSVRPVTDPKHPGPFSCSSMKRPRRGATAVEFALVAPVMFFMVLGIIEVGRGFMVIHLLDGAARAGCRAAIVPGSTTTQVRTKVNTMLASQGVPGTNTTVLVNGSSSTDLSSAQTGDTITVQVTVPVSSFTWVPGGSFLSGSLGAKHILDHE